DDLVHRRQLVTAVTLRRGQREEAGVEERAVPLSLMRPVLVVGRRRRQARIVVDEPRAEAPAERGLLGRVVKVHVCTPRAGAPAPASDPPPHRPARSTTARVSGARARNPPACCRSRREPGSRSRTRFAPPPSSMPSRPPLLLVRHPATPRPPPRPRTQRR